MVKVAMADSIVGGVSEGGSSCNVEPVRWVNGYCSAHYILLVGEGDFSFALSLATSFGSASKLVATSLDREGDLATKYSRAILNADKLRRLGATVLHGVDATVMAADPRLAMQKFDRVVFNFPHAGFNGCESDWLVIELHRELVQKFFCNASRMLRPDGEIHVSHKTSYPFYDWDIEELADWSALRLVDQAVFNKACYPGYMNKRGEGSRCDQTFPIGESSTYKFQIVLGRNFRSKRRRKLRRRLNTCWENYFLLRRYLYSF